MPPDIIPVILAGGQGRRLRPLTGPARPKPFLKIFKNKSLLQMTLERAKDFRPPVIVCDEKFAEAADREAEETGLDAVSIIAEPAQRGTAAAIACAAFLLQDEDALLLVMPSDHVIASGRVFSETVRRAAGLVPDNAPLVFGVSPRGSGRQYGHILTSAAGKNLFALEGFTEKPQGRTARILARTPGVFWNTGIFLCRPRVLLELLAIHAPEIFEATGRAMAEARPHANMLRPSARRYTGIPALSIDHALMEKLHSGVVLPLETGWHDVGCWERLLAAKAGFLTRRLDFSNPDEPGRQRQESS